MRSPQLREEGRLKVRIQGYRCHHENLLQELLISVSQRFKLQQTLDFQKRRTMEEENAHGRLTGRGRCHMHI